MASLHARIPLYPLATLQLTATCIDIYTASLHIGHTHSLSCRDSLVNQTLVFRLVSGFIHPLTLHCVTNTQTEHPHLE